MLRPAKHLAAMNDAAAEDADRRMGEDLLEPNQKYILLNGLYECASQSCLRMLFTEMNKD
jgi:hypothetical protein